LSDICGRRIVLLIGLFGNTISIALFGYSRSIFWAILWRSQNGLLNGKQLFKNILIFEKAILVLQKLI
jgi:hypothetical protein